MDPVTIVIDAGALEAMRIDVTGCPAHAFECLVELASRSVPVTLFSCSGKLRAQLFNPLPKPTALAHWIGDLIGTGEASQPYRAWVEHHVRRLLRAAGLTWNCSPGGGCARRPSIGSPDSRTKMRSGSSNATCARSVPSSSTGGSAWCLGV